MNSRLDFDVDGHDWPNRETSRFVEAGGLVWHVQCDGVGPVILLLHGTGASSHSFRDLMPLLARHHTVIVPDLPGHGFSHDPPSDALSLPGMAKAISSLLDKLDLQPTLVLGHSAGAAVLVRMALDGQIAPDAIIGLNAALLPFRAMTGPVFSALAKMLAFNPFVPWMFATQAANGRLVDRMLAETGSSLDARGTELYRRLTSNSGHVGAALRMMASWDLAALERDLPGLRTPLHLIVGTRDKTISPEQAFEVKKLVHASIKRLQGLGHLAHEERPDLVAEYIAGIEDAAELKSNARAGA